jgi:hypothetical protein
VNGPSFQIPGNYCAWNLDVDSDGTPELRFWESGVICTADFGTAGGLGTFVLTGNTLRSELAFAGRFGSVDMRGPAALHANARSLSTLAPPLVSWEGYSGFFGEVTLTHGQIMQLRRGALYAGADGDVVVGRILPVAAPGTTAPPQDSAATRRLPDHRD